MLILSGNELMLYYISSAKWSKTMLSTFFFLKKKTNKKQSCVQILCYYCDHCEWLFENSWKLKKQNGYEMSQNWSQCLPSIISPIFF